MKCLTVKGLFAFKVNANRRREGGVSTLLSCDSERNVIFYADILLLERKGFVNYED